MKCDNHEARYLPHVILLAVAFFILFGLLNSTGSKNLAMVRIFEPDEAAVLPVIQKMVAPKGSLDDFIRGFIFYGYYYYGFPFFGLSGLIALPFQWFEKIQNTQLLMLALRQLISVLPTIFALIIIVYLQDGFRTFRSVLLFLFLLMIPAVFQNSLWLHPDGLVLLLSALVLLFLVKDNRSLGKNFFISAAFCGILIATKLVGAFFFLAVGLVLIWSLAEKRVTWKKAILSAIGYLFIMAVFFVISNPFLLSEWGRIEYLNIARKQSNMLSSGYGVIYGKGIKSLWPILNNYYGEFIFLFTTVVVLILSFYDKKKNFLSALILAWFVPLTVYLFFFIHFKYQYWLPVALPLFSVWILVLRPKDEFTKMKPLLKAFNIIFVVILTVQVFLFVRQNLDTAKQHFFREKSNPSIQFYENVRQVLNSELDEPLSVYFDYRLYLPDDNSWQKTTSFDLLTYDYIQDYDFDILLLQQQRIKDYLQEGLIGVDPNEFEKSQIFYRDADKGLVDGYVLVFRDSVGLVFQKK